MKRRKEIKRGGRKEHKTRNSNENTRRRLYLVREELIPGRERKARKRIPLIGKTNLTVREKGLGRNRVVGG